MCIGCACIHSGYWDVISLIFPIVPTGNAPVDPHMESDNAHPSPPREWEPLDLTNPQYERHLMERHNLPAHDYIAANKVHNPPYMTSALSHCTYM